MEAAIVDFGEWKPRIKTSMEDLRLEVGAFRKTVNRVVLDTDSSKAAGIFALHIAAMGGHLGVPVTYRRLKQLFAWSGMKKDIYAFVTSCTVYQQAKPDRSKSPRMLQPLPVPSAAWQAISLDFIEDLPSSRGMNAILVVVDRFTKYGCFLLLRHPLSAQSVAKLFLNQVYSLLQCILERIVSLGRC